MPSVVGTVDVLASWALSSTHDFSIGIDPDLVLIFDMGPALDTDNPGFLTGFGAFSATQNVCSHSRGQDNVTPTNATSVVRNDRCHVISTTGTTTAGRMSGSMIAGGFRLTVQEVYGADRKLGYLAIQGLSNVLMGTGSTKADNTDYVQTGFGFTPTFVLFGGGASSVGVNTVTGSAGPSSMGVLVGSSAHAIGHGMQDNNAAENVASQHSTAMAIFASSVNNAGAPSAAHLPGQIDADGFTLTHPTGTTQIPIFWIACAGMQASLQALTTRTTTGTIVTASLGFVPQAVLAFGTLNTTATQGSASSDAQRAVGAAAGANHISTFTLAVDNLNPTDQVHRSSTTRLLQHYDRTGADTFTLVGDLDVQSFDADTVTFEQLDADSSAHLFSVLVLGVPSGGVTYRDMAATFGGPIGGGGGGGDVADFLVNGGPVR